MHKYWIKVFFASLLFCFWGNFSYASEEVRPECLCPDYSFEYVGNDKFENFNRKMFALNSGLNKFAVRPLHILWASIMPKYGMDRIKGITTNIEYPIRLMSTLVQRDFEGSKNETLRFLTNSTIGLAGMYDPAKRFFNIQPTNENMEQALASCKVKSGSYLVLPVLNGTSPRGVAGKVLDTALNPSSYIGMPVLAAVKAGMVVNRTAYTQPLFQMIESNYADPYDISRKLYGLESYMKCKNYDRKEILDTAVNIMEEDDVEIIENNLESELVNNSLEENSDPKKFSSGKISETFGVEPCANEDCERLTVAQLANAGDNVEKMVMNSYGSKGSQLMADKLLYDYNPQHPVTDSMRTALFDLPDVDESIWSEMSVWNRCFAKRIKTSKINIDQNRDDYKFRFILQKGAKISPLAIIFPSIGEGIKSNHSVLYAKLFYDAGYSVLILGSAFQWEFVKSMPQNYRPGIPANDADYLKLVTSKAISKLEKKYDYNFEKRVILGTSYGALTSLFLAEKESKNNTLNISKFIAICPPVELVYAMDMVDRTTSQWNKNPNNLKDRVAIAAAKIIQLSQMPDEKFKKIEYLPFNEDESNLITGFIMHQKLSDLIYTIESENIDDTCEFYKQVNNTSYRDYAQKYLIGQDYPNIKSLEHDSSLHSISEYLKNCDNYKIYHSINDYLTNSEQLKKLKLYTGEKSLYMDNGSHLGFVYRDDFLEELKNEIYSIKN